MSLRNIRSPVIATFINVSRDLLAGLETCDLIQRLDSQDRSAEDDLRSKDFFLAAMSHELRTPLTAIIGYAHLLQDGQVGEVDTDQRECLAEILASSEHLLELVSEAVEISAAESGGLAINPERFDIAAVTHEVAESLRPLAEEREIVLDTDRVDDLGEVNLDPTRYRQVVLNYLSNALKFTPSGGLVSVTLLRSERRRIRVQVDDSGIGIAPKNRHRLFEDFQQFGVPLSGSTRGAGLGLSLTRRIVEASEGEVGFRSTEGVGSSFWAELPTELSPGDRVALSWNGRETRSERRNGHPRRPAGVKSFTAPPAG